MGGGGDLLPRRGARRRLLQPLPDHGAARRVPAAGCRATRSRRSRRSSSSCSRRWPESGCSIALDLRLVRGAYSIDPEHPLSRALRAAYEDIAATELPLTGMKVAADAAVFQGEAASPSHGPAGSGAHADVEYVPVAELVRATRVYLRLRASFCPVGMSGYGRAIGGCCPSDYIGVEVWDRQRPYRDPRHRRRHQRTVSSRAERELEPARERAPGAGRRAGHGRADPLAAGRDRGAPRHLQARRDILAVPRAPRSAPTRWRCDFVAPSHSWFSASGRGARAGARLRRDRDRRSTDLERLLTAASPGFAAAATSPTPWRCSSTPPHRAAEGSPSPAPRSRPPSSSHDFFPQPGDRIWTPAEVGWIGGLYDVVMPGPPTAPGVHTLRFDPEQAFDVIAQVDQERLHARDRPADDAALHRGAGGAAHDRERGRDGGRGTTAARAASASAYA